MVNLRKIKEPPPRPRRRPEQDRDWEEPPTIGFEEPPPIERMDPLGNDWYITPGDPIDPQDCDFWPNSPYCGGGIIPDPRDTGIEPVIVRDKCTFGIRLDPSILGIKGPSVAIVRRDRDCDPAPPPPPPPPGGGGRHIEPFNEPRYYIFNTESKSESQGWANGPYDGQTASYFEKGQVEGINFLCDPLYPIEYIGYRERQWTGFLGDDYNKDFYQSGIRTEPGYDWPRPNRFSIAGPGFNGAAADDEKVINRLIDDYNYSYSTREFYYDSQWTHSLIPAGFYKIKDICNLDGEPPTLYPPYPEAPPPTTYRPPPPPPPPMSCCPPKKNDERLLRLILSEVKKANKAIGSDELKKDIPKGEKSNALIPLMRKSFTRLGINQFPAKLPKRWIYPNAKGQESIDDLPEFLGFIAKFIDRVAGFLPIKIKVKDADPAKEGDQKVEMHIQSFSDFARELMQFVIDMEGDGDLTNIMLVKCLYELGLIHQGAVKTGYAVDAILEDLDFKVKYKTVNIPFAFDPYAGSAGQGFASGKGKLITPIDEKNLEKLIPKLLRSREIPIRVVENVQPKSLLDLIQEINRNAGLAAAGAAEPASKLDDLIKAAQEMLQLQGIIDRENTRRAMAAGKLVIRKKK